MRNFKVVGVTLMFFVLTFFAIPNAFAYTLSVNEDSSQGETKTIEAAFELPSSDVNALSVRMQGVGITLKNVEIIDKDNYLVLPECKNEEIFTSTKICFSLASEKPFEDGKVFLLIELTVDEPTNAGLVKLSGSKYSNGEKEYASEGQLSFVEGGEDTDNATQVTSSTFSHENQVYTASSALIAFVFLFSVAFLTSKWFSFDLKLGVSFVALALIAFGLYAVYSTYSSSQSNTDTSVAAGLNWRTCSDVIDKVCGVDGKTYNNDCIAAAFGVEVACDGTCPCGGDSTYSEAAVCGDGICDLGEDQIYTCAAEGAYQWNSCTSVTGTCPEDCTDSAISDGESTTAMCSAMDINDDGKFTIVDFSAFVRVYQKECNNINMTGGALITSEDLACGSQDVNGDGKVNLIDFANFVKRYNKDSCTL